MSVAPQSSADKSTRFMGLQWLRGVAALLVLFYHAGGFLPLLTGQNQNYFTIPPWLGALGVTLFFALSGYLMQISITRSDSIKFIIRRVARIYPIYFICLFILFNFTPMPTSFDWRAATLFPVGTATYALGVEWTLIFEVAFYVFLFVILALNAQNHILQICIAWLGLILIHNIVWPDNPGANLYPPLSLPFAAAAVGLAAGIIVPRLMQIPIHPVTAAILGIALWQLGSTLFGTTGLRWGMGFGAAIFVTALARYQGRKLMHPVLDRIGDKFGEYSYALYLTHAVAVQLIYAYFGNSLSGIQLFGLAIGTSLLIGFIMGEVDIRVHQLVRNALENFSRPIQATLAYLFATSFFGVFLYFAIKPTF